MGKMGQNIWNWDSTGKLRTCGPHMYEISCYFKGTVPGPALPSFSQHETTETVSLRLSLSHSLSPILLGQAGYQKGQVHLKVGPRTGWITRSPIIAPSTHPCLPVPVLCAAAQKWLHQRASQPSTPSWTGSRESIWRHCRKGRGHWGIYVFRALQLQATGPGSWGPSSYYDLLSWGPIPLFPLQVVPTWGRVGLAHSFVTSFH